MAITTTWSINDMTHTNDDDGGVVIVYWTLTATRDGDAEFTAQEGGKLRLTPDPSSKDYIPYRDLKESDVLGWVYNSLIEEDETADEAKARIEVDRTAKVQKQIDTAHANVNGVPWT